MPWAYASRNALKTRLGETLTDNDAIYKAVLEAVSESIDSDPDISRTFRIYLATRYLSAVRTDKLLLDADLLAVTTLKTDEDGDRTYEKTWATTDYDLMPFNAAADRNPYWKIAQTPEGDYSFPVIQKGVEIVGKWGWWEDLLTAASILTAAINSTTTTIPVTAGTDFEVLQTLKCDDEAMYITAISSNNLTVERAVNGTTAASHLINAVTKIYRYPSPVIEATLIQAASIFKRKEAPFGVIGGSDLAVPRNIPALDPDVKRLLRPYMQAVMVGG